MKLDFEIKVDGKARHPRWKEVETEHTTCPKCIDQKMVVILGHQGILYAFCYRCQTYFIGE